MSRARLPLVLLVAAALLGAGGTLNGPAEAGTSGADAAIVQAALAPFRDALLGNAGAFCSDLTPAAEAGIVPGAPPGETCEQAVEGVFAATPPSLPRAAALALKASVVHLAVAGSHATGVFSLTTTEERRKTHDGVAGEALVVFADRRLSLEEIAGRWLVSSQARLAPVDCQKTAHSHCGAAGEHVLFVLGEPVGGPTLVSVQTPPAVRRAGAREQQEFAAGRRLVAQSGCLACHRIGDAGNRGPGESLSHIGAQLSRRQIERVLVRPSAPMPSFKNLPPSHLRDLVRFLSLLK
ncbi:MAG TPA: hypothetical protein VGY13_01500 [Solirubrobacteraceae bacterium]|jgi:hypothetical protein|nr:hypothetical protein [Solirubrobacteraceae bacterium]